LTVYLTFLDGKCAGQELLERFAIEAGITTHTDFHGCNALRPANALHGNAKQRDSWIRKVERRLSAVL
jgi:hypothetical protein